jgi:hypothetical protein
MPALTVAYKVQLPKATETDPNLVSWGAGAGYT